MVNHINDVDFFNESFDKQLKTVLKFLRLVYLFVNKCKVKSCYIKRRVKLFQLVENVPTNDGNRSLCRVNFCYELKKIYVSVYLKTSVVNK